MNSFQEVVTYSRCSDVEQKKGGSISRQKEGHRSFSNQKSWAVVSEISDEGRSGYHGDHRKASGALGQFEAEAERGEHIGRIFLVEQLDRLSREKPEETWMLIAKLNKAGVSICTRKNGRLYPAGQSLPFFDIMEVLCTASGNHEESKKKSAHIAREWDKRRERARANGTALTKLVEPWIIVNEDRTMKLDEARSALVLRWFEMSHAGAGAKTIADTLDREGTPTWPRFVGRTPKRWNRTFIANTLRNRAVVGEFTPTVLGVAQEPWTNYFPACVPADLFAAVAGAAPIRKKAAIGLRGQKIVNIVSGLISCTSCGENLRYSSGRSEGSKWTNPQGKTYSYRRDCGSLVCPLAEVGKCDNSRYLAYLTFEDALLGACLHLALDDNAFANRGEAARLGVTIAERERSHELALRSFKNLKGEWAERPTPLRKSMADEAEAAVEELEANLVALNLQRDAARGRADSAAHLKRVSDIREAIYDPDLSSRALVRKKVKQALTALIERIVYDGENITVNFVAGAAVLRFNRKGRLLSAFDLVRDGRVVAPELADYARRRLDAKVRGALFAPRAQEIGTFMTG